ncbi:MAG: PilT/PilU family type 4a pilus ATPase [Planctomycetota bacterium]
MTETPTMATKLYPVNETHTLSMRDLLDYFTRHGSMRVSDLHLKVGCPPVYRIDGQMQRLKGPPLEKPIVATLAKTLLTELEWQTLDEERSVDSSYLSETMQFRLNVFHDNDGLVVAIRALESNPPPLEEIGFPNGVAEDIIKRQFGLVLVTGITGAGKSTTIASLIHRIAETRPCRIITLEDPIEYQLPSKQAIISQREVGRDVPSYEHGLRDCLREDPDVIFVGEMRDRDAASWTLTAAETGHLVFSTLHTRDTRGTVTRILDFFPEGQQDEVSNQLSLGLSHVLSQKLIPRADGSGRVVAMEILNNTYGVSNLIRLNKMEQIYTQLQSRTKDVPEERMMTLERCLARLVRTGAIAPLEAEKWANHRAAFLDELQQVQ